MYASQQMRSQWFGMLGEDYNEGSDEEQDTVKVCHAFVDFTCD